MDRDIMHPQWISNLYISSAIGWESFILPAGFMLRTFRFLGVKVLLSHTLDAKRGLTLISIISVGESLSHWFLIFAPDLTFAIGN
jgi:hypothetical protein